MVRVRSGNDRAVWPLAVAGLPPRSARSRARPLVVLPALTWQGLNRLDDDADGFGDRLPFARAVRLDRPFADGGLPPRFAAEVSPLLRWLDRERLAYDLTTDLALARREGPALGNAPGVAFAGSELWVPRQLMERLRDYVADGGRVADVRRRLVQAHGRSARRHRTQPVAAPARERVRRADRAAAHQQGAAHGVRGRPRAVRGHVELRGRVHGVRGLTRSSARALAGSRPRAATPASRPSWRLASAVGSCCGPERRSGRGSSRNRRSASSCR